MMPRISSWSMTSRICASGKGAGTGGRSAAGGVASGSGGAGAGAVSATASGASAPSAAVGTDSRCCAAVGDAASGGAGWRVGCSKGGAGSTERTGSESDTSGGSSVFGRCKGTGGGDCAGSAGASVGATASSTAAAAAPVVSGEVGGGGCGIAEGSARAISEPVSDGRFRLQKIKPIPRTSTARIAPPARTGRSRLERGAGTAGTCGDLRPIACVTVLPVPAFRAEVFAGSCWDWAFLRASLMRLMAVRAERVAEYGEKRWSMKRSKRGLTHGAAHVAPGDLVGAAHKGGKQRLVAQTVDKTGDPLGVAEDFAYGPRRERRAAVGAGEH